MKKYWPVWVCVGLACAALLGVIGTSALSFIRRPQEIAVDYAPGNYGSIEAYADMLKSRSDEDAVLYVPAKLPADMPLSWIQVQDGSYVSLIYGSDADGTTSFQYSQHFLDPEIAIPQMIENNSGVYTEITEGDRTYYYAFGPKHHFVYAFDGCCFIVEIPAQIDVGGEVHEITLEEALTCLELERIT